MGAVLGLGLWVAGLLLEERVLASHGLLDLLGIQDEAVLYLRGAGPAIGAGLGWRWARESGGLGVGLGASLGWAAALSLGLSSRLGGGLDHLASVVGALLAVSGCGAALAAGLGGWAEDALVQARRHSL